MSDIIKITEVTNRASIIIKIYVYLYNYDVGVRVCNCIEWCMALFNPGVCVGLYGCNFIRWCACITLSDDIGVGV